MLQLRNWHNPAGIDKLTSILLSEADLKLLASFNKEAFVKHSIHVHQSQSTNVKVIPQALQETSQCTSKTWCKVSKDIACNPTYFSEYVWHLLNWHRSK